jgi:hypothetical protein
MGFQHNPVMVLIQQLVAPGGCGLEVTEGQAYQEND